MSAELAGEPIASEKADLLGTLSLDYALSTPIFLAFFFVAALTAQVSANRFHPLFYWATVVATTSVGTTTSDMIDRTLGLGYVKGSAGERCRIAGGR